MDERRRRPRFIGRAPELVLLGERLADASSGVPVAVTIGGEAGCGRTRLIHEFLGSAPDDTLVLPGTCYDGHDPPVPFAPLVDALRVLKDDGAGPLSLASADAGPRAEVFERVLTRLEWLGRERTVVVALEDLHLADSATLDLLAFLVANLRAARVMLLLTWCSEKLPGGADLRSFVAGLVGDAGATPLELAPLDRPHLARLIADARRARVDPAVEAAVWARSEGNPCYALELLAAMGDGGRDDPHCPLPDTLAGLMRARLDALGCRARQVVRAAAAAGRQVDHGLLAEAAALPPDELFAALHEAVDHQVLVPTDDGEGYRFRHALLHEAAYAQLLPGERRYLLHVPAPRTPPSAFPPARLTPRELQVLSLVATGDSNRTIAQELSISEKTASVHVSNILAKLGARSRTAAAATAHRLGVLG